MASIDALAAAPSLPEVPDSTTYNEVEVDSPTRRRSARDLRRECQTPFTRVDCLKSRVSDWWVNALVPKGNRKLQLNGNATMWHHCAPGLKYTYLAVILSMLMDLTFFIVTWKSTDCAGKSARWPVFHVLGLFAISVSVLLALEVKILGYTLIPYFQICKPKLPILGPVRFPTWLIVNMIMSVFNHWVSVNEGIFAAVAIREYQCNEDIQRTWAPTISTSVWYQFSSVLRHFDRIVLAWWLLTFVSQFWAFPETMQSCCIWPWHSRCWTAEHPVENDEAIEDRFGLHTTQEEAIECAEEAPIDFVNVFCNLTTSGDALYSAGESAHFATIECQGLEYCATRERETREMFFDSETRDIHCAVEVLVKCLTYTRHLLARALHRIFCNGILRGGFQINLNVTLLAIRIHRSRIVKGSETRDEVIQAVMFFVISFIAMIGPFYEGMYALKKVWRGTRDWQSEFSIGIVVSDTRHTGSALGQNPAYWPLRKTVLNQLIWAIVALIILILIFAYAILKLIMGYFVCDGAMWNVTGCVQFSEIA